MVSIRVRHGGKFFVTHTPRTVLSDISPRGHVHIASLPTELNQ